MRTKIKHHRSPKDKANDYISVFFPSGRVKLFREAKRIKGLQLYVTHTIPWAINNYKKSKGSDAIFLSIKSSGVRSYKVDY